MPAGRPDAEHAIDESLVRRLLEAQHPDLNGLPVALLDSGWDNVSYRLGDEYVVRIPRREIAAQLIRNEQRWLPKLAPDLPIPIPAPIRLGSPTTFYPWHWSLCPYFSGQCADERPPGNDQTALFAEFLLAVHQPAPGDAPDNPVRGVPLDVRVENTLERMSRLRANTDLITPNIDRIWQAALEAPVSGESRWLHGDLHPQNVLINEHHEFSAIIDWGDITAGDVATDLAGLWTLFEAPEARQAILNRYQPDQHTLTRARGWAVLFGVVLLDSGLINSPRHARTGEKILQRLDQDRLN